MGNLLSSCFKPSAPKSAPASSASAPAPAPAFPTPQIHVSSESSEKVQFPTPSPAPLASSHLQAGTPAGSPPAPSIRSALSGISATDAASSVLDAAAFGVQFAPVPGLAAGVTVLQGIVAAFARVEYNKEQCQLLRDRSEECLQAINESWKPEDESTLAPAVNKFTELLTEIRTSMETYASYTRFESFIQQFNIAGDVEKKLQRLDHTLAAFGLAAAMNQHRWSQDFAAAREKDSKNLGEVLKGQEEIKNLNQENRAALDRVLGDLQTLLRQQAPGPAQDRIKSKILTIQNISNVGLPETNLLSKIECQKIGSEPIAGTSTYEIWVGQWMGQQKVALKVLRGLRVEEMDKYKKRCERQVSIWSKLHNEYILPLYGICSDDGPFPYLVSPWCSNGDANRYLKDKPAVDRLKICLDAAYGLRYLHSLPEPIIHGAMKGSNILISDDGKALLADFGMSNIIESPFTQSNGPGASFRWMAPEIQGGKYTKGCDIWAWGMTTLELVSGKQPFASIKMPGTVLLKVAQGERPDQKEYDSTVLKGNLWSLLQSCWHKDPEKRPSIDVVVKKMEAILEAHRHA
ncbi:hypothetical protein BOTBODRAFT_176617 [Botryobasidium botryosum FD-172 SS1]|uniref:Protein kinase domain-containing protein n=1 Tax=Botryobasidium botryosum (strain FD-172 SS1) TaxID=930990 RepID=A0A067M8G7_BOTB1|nr:hypothetical protein BOTBODRAFT_176617 [Botryobasidium botryosum FD-172 SS1]